MIPHRFIFIFVAAMVILIIIFLGLYLDSMHQYQIHYGLNQTSDCTFVNQTSDCKFEALQEELDCWTSGEGMWVKDSASQPLITKIFSNDGELHTKIYSACGPRTNLDYVWEPKDTCAPLPSPAWSTANTCRVMKGRAIVFMGDSLSMHMGVKPVDPNPSYACACSIQN